MMPQGKSGRVVIDIDPELKAELYVELAKRQVTMKEWFLTNAGALLAEGRRQPLLWETTEKKERTS